MATQAQYQCFKDIYDRETKRAEQLIDRGKIYLSIVTLYIGLLGIAADKIVPKLIENWSAQAFYIISLIGFVLSLSLVIFAIGIYCYSFPTDPKNVIFGFGEKQPTDEEFFDARIVEFAVAFHANSSVNEKRASLLKYATWLMLLGVACQSYVLSAIIFLKSPNERLIMSTEIQSNLQENKNENEEKKKTVPEDYGETMRQMYQQQQQQTLNMQQQHQDTGARFRQQERQQEPQQQILQSFQKQQE